MPHFKRQTAINGNKDMLIQDLLTMPGVNYELMPVVRMTSPNTWRLIHLKNWPVGEDIFKSVILLFGIIPVDLHTFKLIKVDDSGFEECSSSVTNKEWKHRRIISEQGSGCLITDEVSFTPNIKFTGCVMKKIYQLIFKHRHHRLEAKYGASI